MVEPKFRMSSQVSQGSDFTYHLLSEDEKRRLCYELLSEFGVINITERGDELVHSCVMPWHADRHPSAQLNYRKLTYRCWSCESSGGLLWLIGSHQETSSTKARKWLQSKAEPGVVDDDTESLAALLDFFDAIYSGDIDQESPIPVMSPKVLDPWRCIHPYFTEWRGIPQENVERFELGYGIIPADRDGRTINSHRVIIPHFWEGKLVGWQSRRMTADGTPKWLSSPDFPKKRTLFNHDPSQDVAVVVEAPLSVVAKNHLAHFVATFGASFSDEQIKHLSSYQKVILWMDNDDAGWRVVSGRDRCVRCNRHLDLDERCSKCQRRDVEHEPGLAERLEPYVPVWVVDSSWDADPADMDDELVVALIEDAVPFAVWNPPEEVHELIRKHGVGEVIPEGEPENEGESKNKGDWNDADTDELAEENSQADQDDPES